MGVRIGHSMNGAIDILRMDGEVRIQDERILDLLLSKLNKGSFSYNIGKIEDGSILIILKKEIFTRRI